MGNPTIPLCTSGTSPDDELQEQHENSSINVNALMEPSISKWYSIFTKRVDRACVGKPCMSHVVALCGQVRPRTDESCYLLMNTVLSGPL